MDDLPLDSLASSETATPELDFARFGSDGDATALHRALEAVSPQVATAAHHFAGRPEDAEDLVQETFLRAIRQAERFDPNRSLTGWLYGILRHVAQEQRRRRQRSALTADPIADRDPSLELAERETAAMIQQALRGVPANYRDVLHRRLVDGQGAVEIARALRTPVATVRSKLQRGLRLLRQLLPAGLGVALYAACAPRARAAIVRRALPPTRTLPVNPGTLRLWLLPLAAAGIVALGIAMLTIDLDGVPARPAPPRPSRTAAIYAPAEQPATVPTERIAVTQPEVTVRGVVDVGTAYEWRDATLRAVAVAPAITPVLLVGVALDPDAAAAAARLQELTNGAAAATAAVTTTGEFELRLPAGSYVLDLVDDRCGLLAPRVVAVPATAAEQPCHDVGVLLGYHGRTLSGRVPPPANIARVTLFAQPEALDPFSDTTVSQTARRGRLVAPVDERGEFLLRAVWRNCAGTLVADGHDGRWFARIEPQTGPPHARSAGAATETVTLQPATRTLTVHLEGADVAPATPGELWLTHESGFETRMPVTRDEFTIPHLLPGSHTITFHGRTGDCRCRRIESHLDTVWLRRPQRPPLQGLVLDSNGDPVAGAQVFAVELTDNPRPPPRPTRAYSDAAGRFTLPAPTTPAAHLAVDAGSGRRLVIRVAERQQLEVRVPTIQRLTGRVTASSGKGAVVITRLTDRDTTGQLLPRATTHWLAADGTFEVPDLPSDCGSVHILASGVGGATIRLDEATVVDGGLDLGDVELEPYSNLHGQVVDEGGHPVPDAIVAALVPGLGQARSLLQHPRRTDGCGRFTFAMPLTPGLELVAWTRDYESRGSRPIELEDFGAAASATGTPLELVVHRHQEPGTTTNSAGPAAVDDPESVSAATARCRVTITVPEQYCRPGAELLLATEGGGLQPLVRSAAKSVVVELPPGHWTLDVAIQGKVLDIGRRLLLTRADRATAVTLHPEETRIRGEIRGGEANHPAMVVLMPADAERSVVFVPVGPSREFEQAGIDPDNTQVLVLSGTATEALCAKGTGRDGVFTLQPTATVSWTPDPTATTEPAIVHLERLDGRTLRMPLTLERRGTSRFVTVPPGRITLRIADREHEVTVQTGEEVALEDK
ncbi:MAG: sigma-70 family RNA polymerase sigma factor [bacterium]|nr:sigma-70 family RNA polymerase sigma factor [bacterium]